jgi:hypothetical protein
LNGEFGAVNMIHCEPLDGARAYPLSGVNDFRSLNQVTLKGEP